LPTPGSPPLPSMPLPNRKLAGAPGAPYDISPLAGRLWRTPRRPPVARQGREAHPRAPLVRLFPARPGNAGAGARFGGDMEARMPKPVHRHDVVIIGGGPAGLTAGIYAGRADLDTVIIEKALPGGQISQTEEVENYPGFPEPVSGAELSQRMVAQAERFGARIVMDEVSGLAHHPEGGFLVHGYEADYHASALIIATGANPRRLDVPGEDELYGRGVSTCATCDGFFYRGREVVVVGG